MKIGSLVGRCIILLGLVAISCGPAAAPAPDQEIKTPSIKVSKKDDWEQKWEDLVAEARKEGVVATITLAWPPKVVNLISQAFRDRYGITVENSPTGRGAEMVVKIKAEQAAGLYTYDFFGTGSGTALNIMKPDGLLGPIEPFFILPEVKDVKSWRNGRIPFLDEDKRFLGMVASKQHYLIYNTELIKKGEVSSYKDVLRTEYAGRITINDPTTSGPGTALFNHLAVDIWNMEEAQDFLRQLIKQQKAVIERDNRIHVESVARGKYAIALGTSPEVVAAFIEAGAPIVPVVAQEGTNITSAAAGIALPVRMAHPKAAAVFLNWLLSKEGQTVFTRGWGAPSMRLDASTEGINPSFLFQPGEKIFPPSEKKSLAMAQWLGIAKRIIEEAGRK